MATMVNGRASPAPDQAQQRISADDTTIVGKEFNHSLFIFTRDIIALHSRKLNLRVLTPNFEP